MLRHERKEKKQALLSRQADFESRLAKIRAKEKMIRERFEKGEPQYKRQVLQFTYVTAALVILILTENDYRPKRRR